MARRLTPKALFEQLMARMEPKIARAFKRAIDGIRSRVDYALLVKLLTAGDIEGAIASLPLRPEAYDVLADTIRDEYVNAGATHQANLPGRLSEILFSGRNPRAEQYLREHSSDLVTGIIDSQREAVRQALTEGMSTGTAPRALASRIVGPVSRVTGLREGGILGLTPEQASWVASARRELTGGDLSNYFRRERRDRRDDAIIRRAQRQGTPVPPEVVERAVSRYERRMLQLRGQTIARTEAMTGLHAAQYESLLQSVDSGVIVAEQVKRKWRDSSDLRVRHTHASLDGQVVGLFDKFVSISGAQLQFPADPKAPAGERINCRCWAETIIDFLFGIK